MNSNNANSVYQNIFKMLDKAGVPDSTTWRSLILYFRELKDYSHMSDSQKAEIQSLLSKTLEGKDYSEKGLHAVLAEYQNIIIGPHKKRVDELLREASVVIGNFQNLLTARYGNLEDLEELTISSVETLSDESALVERLRGAFEGVKSLLENDIRSLENLATLDSLTNIPNRRAFDDFMVNAVGDWQHKGREISVALFDIDFFKRFNDQHGHRIGDQVLQLVAKYIARQVQPLLERGNIAIAARYGGEEFVLAVSGPSCDQLPEIVEGIRTAISNFNFLIRDTNGNVVENGLRITVSAGISRCWDGWKGAFAENLIDGADKALYYAKSQGRDKAALFSPEHPDDFQIVQEKDALAPETAKG